MNKKDTTELLCKAKLIVFNYPNTIGLREIFFTDTICIPMIRNRYQIGITNCSIFDPDAEASSGTKQKVIDELEIPENMCLSYGNDAEGIGILAKRAGVQISEVLFIGPDNACATIARITGCMFLGINRTHRISNVATIDKLSEIIHDKSLKQTA